MNQIDKIKEKIRILKNAKNEIRLVKIFDNWWHTCYDTAICSYIWGQYDADSTCKNELTIYISKALGGYGYYHNWLENKIKIQVTPKIAKQGRIGWLNYMIKCLEEDLQKLKTK